MIKLYGVTASTAGCCRWMLEELELEYEQIPIHFRDEQIRSPDYLAINPNGRIPALDDGGLVIWESMAINLYLAEKYDRGLWPGSREGRAHAVQWSFWVMTEISPLIRVISPHRVDLPQPERDPGKADAAEAALHRPLAVLEAPLSKRPYVLGDTYSVADVNLASILGVGFLCDVDFSSFPNVLRWLRECTLRPAARRSQAPAERE